jgi:putative ABC transport system permease protein
MPVMFAAAIGCFAVALAVVALRSRQVLFLSVRNLLRNKRRTIITVTVITFGTTGLMLQTAFMENAFTSLRDATITSGLGHIQIYKNGFNEKAAVDKTKYAIDNYGDIKSLLVHDPVIGKAIKSVTATVEFNCLVGSAEASAVCMGTGLEVGEDDVLSATDRLVEGRRLDGAGQQDEGLIGQGLAHAIGAKVGDILTVMAVTRTGAINAVDMSLKGVVQGAATEYDNTILKLPLKHAQQLMARGDVSRIVVLLNDTARTREVSERLGVLFKEKGLDLETRTWEDLAVYYQSVVELYRGMFIVFLVIVLTVVVFSILNTMTMSVLERVREIGTLRALGAPKTEVRGMIHVEGVLMGLLGAGMAIVSALVIAFVVNHLMGGLQMPPPPQRTFGYRATFDLVQHPAIWLFGIFTSLIAGALSSIIPARTAAKMEIVDALRHY